MPLPTEDRFSCSLRSALSRCAYRQNEVVCALLLPTQDVKGFKTAGRYGHYKYTSLLQLLSQPARRLQVFSEQSLNEALTLTLPTAYENDLNLKVACNVQSPPEHCCHFG